MKPEVELGLSRSVWCQISHTFSKPPHPLLLLLARKNDVGQVGRQCHFPWDTSVSTWMLEIWVPLDLTVLLLLSQSEVPYLFFWWKRKTKQSQTRFLSEPQEQHGNFYWFSFRANNQGQIPEKAEFSSFSPPKCFIMPAKRKKRRKNLCKLYKFQCSDLSFYLLIF